MSAEEKIEKINELLYRYSQIEGSHHKAWVLDQIARIVHGDKYDEFVYNYEHFDEDGNELIGDRYEWDCGINP